VGQTNSRRVSHNISVEPNTFRDVDLSQILNDIDEEESGKGYSELEYLPGKPFVSRIITYVDQTKQKKRSVVDFTYSPQPFVSLIVRSWYDQDDDSLVVSTITATVNYNANKSVQSINIVTTRP